MFYKLLKSWCCGLIVVVLVSWVLQIVKVYQVDCVILFCLVGGWFVLVECVYVCVVFICWIMFWLIELLL